MESKTTEVNLPQTGVEVVIPEEQRVLLEVNTDRYGIHQQMESCSVSSTAKTSTGHRLWKVCTRGP
jgi:hypothetical protein